MVVTYWYRAFRISTADEDTKRK